MATRAFARVTTDFHDEPSIRNLTPDQQWAYDVVYKRPDLSRCGVVAYTPRRWAKFAKGMTETKLRRLYDQLANTRHIVLDDDTEELLIRTYVRHDGLLTQPNVVAAMVSDYRLISSSVIKTAFLIEMRRIWDLDLEQNARGGWLLAMGHYPPAVDGQVSKFPEHMPTKSIAFLQKSIGAGLTPDLAEGIQEGSIRPFEEGSEKGSPQPFQEGSRARMRATPSPSPSPSPAPPPAPTSGREPFPVTDPADTDPHTPPLQHPARALALLDEHTPWVPKVRGELAPIVDELLTAGIAEDAIRTGIATWRSSRKGPRYLANLVQDQLTPKAVNGTSRATDNLAVISRLEALEGGRT
jgi:hypothetical protein